MSYLQPDLWREFRSVAKGGWITLPSLTIKGPLFNVHFLFLLVNPFTADPVKALHFARLV